MSSSFPFVDEFKIPFWPDLAAAGQTLSSYSECLRRQDKSVHPVNNCEKHTFRDIWGKISDTNGRFCNKPFLLGSDHSCEIKVESLPNHAFADSFEETSRPLRLRTLDGFCLSVFTSVRLTRMHKGWSYYQSFYAASNCIGKSLCSRRKTHTTIEHWVTVPQFCGWLLQCMSWLVTPLCYLALRLIFCIERNCGQS